jgi:hypothetical protein
VRKVTADKVLEGLKGEGGKVMKTSLDHTKEAALQAALAGVQAAVPASTSWEYEDQSTPTDLPQILVIGDWEAAWPFGGALARKRTVDFRRGHIRGFDMALNGSLAMQADRAFADPRGSGPGGRDAWKSIQLETYTAAGPAADILDSKEKMLYRIVHGYPTTTNISSIDTNAMDRSVFAALRPGGTYLITDYVAAAGSGTRGTQSLHRIDPEVIKREVTAAGFMLEGRLASNAPLPQTALTLGWHQRGSGV